MLTKYEAATLAKRAATAGVPACAKAALLHNRIGVTLVALSLLAALALLYSAWFDWAPGPRTARAVPVSSIAPVIHPATTGLPEAALFLRHPNRDAAAGAD